MKKSTNVLLVDDDVSVALTLSAVLERENYRVAVGHSLNEMSGLLQKTRFDAAVVDLRLGQESGLQALELLRTRQPHCRSIVLTGYPSVETTVAALRLRAFDFLTKPCDLEQLKHALAEAHKDAHAARACLDCLKKLRRPEPA